MNVIERLLARRAERREGIPSERAVRRCLSSGHSIACTMEDGSIALDISLDVVLIAVFSTGITRPISENAVQRVLTVCAVAADDDEGVYGSVDEHGQHVEPDLSLHLPPQARRLLTRVLSVRARMRTG